MIMCRGPLRAVRSAEPMPGWWTMSTPLRDWFVVASCGHCLIRRRSLAPKRLFCEVCIGREP